MTNIKIGNAFSLNMVELPANVHFSRMTIERVREMISDTPEKEAARMLIAERRISVTDDDDDRTVIEYDKIDGNRSGRYWEFMHPKHPRYAEQEDVIRELGLVPDQTDIVDIIVSNEAEAVSLDSCIGHADTARIVGGMLGVELPANRVNVKLSAGEKMIVAQYSGPRLPEGATVLPEGAKIEFVQVKVS